MPEIKVGLECHCYLNMASTRQKLFCECAIDSNAASNTNICPICTGQPGNKPMLPNKEAVDKILAVALMLNCKINHSLIFQRKHYSWPDLPNGYQKTMSGSYSVPVGENGNFLGIGIREVHLEEDPAKWDPLTGCVDYNRSGFPLIEIVTEPDFRNTTEVREWLKKLITTLGYIAAVDEDAGIKSDVNVSIAPKYRRVEIKNVNSFKSIIAAIEYEVKRQEEETKAGNEIAHETRAWSDEEGITIKMRSKETAADYMFIPDPDLPIIEAHEDYIKEIEKTLPEKPHEKIEKYIKQHKIDKEDATVIASDILLAELFEKTIKTIDPILAGRWIRRELLRVLNYNKKELKDIMLDEVHFIELLDMAQKKEITDETAKKILEQLITKPFSPKEYVKKEGLAAVSGEHELKKFCEEAIKENPKAVEDYKAGEEKSFNFIVGQVMRKSKGKAAPDVVNKILKEILD